MKTHHPLLALTFAGLVNLLGLTPNVSAFNEPEGRGGGAPSPGSSLPVITAEPQSVTVYETNSAEFQVFVSSELPVTFQWRKDGNDLPGETFQYLTIYNASPANNGGYDVIVSNSNGSVTSQVAQLVVNLRPPQITILADDQEVAVGLPLFLYAFVTGSEPLYYSWLKDGVPIPNAISNRYELATTQFSDSGNYRLIVSNSVMAVTSIVVRVSVVLFTLQGPYDALVFFGWDRTLSTFTQSSVPVDYQWYFNDTLVPGATGSFFDIRNADFSDAGDYYVIATNIYGAITSMVATVTVITQAPSASIYISRGSTILVGDDFVFGASVGGGPKPALQWRRNGMALPGETNVTLSLFNVSIQDTGDYTIVATNIHGSVTSAPVHLEVVAKAPFFVVRPAVSNALEGSIVALRSLALSEPPPYYYWFRNDHFLPGQTNAVLWLANTTTNDSGEYSVMAGNGFGLTLQSSFLNIIPATGLDRWDWRRPQPQGGRLKDVAFGNGRYVAVGRSGNIVTSSNGVDWENTIIEIDGDFETVAFGNGVFVVAGSMSASAVVKTNVSSYPAAIVIVELVSSNGVDWTVGQAPEHNFIPDITFGDGLFVASGVPGRAFNFTSVDGRHWQPQRGPALPAQQLAFGGGRFVASSGISFYYSSNAIDWIFATNSITVGFIRSITYGNNRFVALNSGGSVLSSPDGMTWTESLISNFPGQDLAGGAGKFVACLQSPAGSVMVSSDTIDWTMVDTGTDHELESVIYAGEFIAVGEAGTITTSPDGMTWSPSVAANAIDYYGLANGRGLVVAAGDSGTILITADGRNWTQPSTPTTRNLHSVHYANGLFVAGGRGGTIITSSNGSNWVSRVSGIDDYVERINYANGLWVAAAEHGDFCISTDGLNWTGGSTPGPQTDHEGVAYGNGLWVMVGGYFQDPVLENNAVPTIYVSTSGLQWTLVPFTASVRLRDVTFGGGRFIAVANDGLIYGSTNGTVWNAYHSGHNTNLRRVHYGNGRFVIVGNDGFMRSSPRPEDPLAWTAHRSRTTQNLHDILSAADGTFYAVGNNGMILQSQETRPRFTIIRGLYREARIEFDPGIAGDSLRLEASGNLRDWNTLQAPAVNRALIDTDDIPVGFFRLVTP